MAKEFRFTFTHLRTITGTEHIAGDDAVISVGFERFFLSAHVRSQGNGTQWNPS